jgi:hypothetical protein
VLGLVLGAWLWGGLRFTRVAARLLHKGNRLEVITQADACPLTVACRSRRRRFSPPLADTAHRLSRALVHRTS